MKKIIYYIALSVMCVLPFSCSDMLEEENRTEMEKKNYMNTAAEAEKVLLGIYSTLSTDNLYGQNLSILFNTGTDMVPQSKVPVSFLQTPSLQRNKKYKLHGLHFILPFIMPMNFWNVFH